ncbi:MAG: deoxyribose-phosphate aldolase [Burkholderiaceae bacterium]
MSGYEALGTAGGSAVPRTDVSDASLGHARVALACLDLTSLGDTDTALQVASLVMRSRGGAGAPAALCVWPRFVGQVVGLLASLHGPASRPKVAAVANFPSGQEPLESVLAQVRQILSQGGDEVDLVLDWRAMRSGGAAAVEGAARTVRAVRQACGTAGLKLIIESGELREPALIALACRIGLNEGVDILKTSTGKTATGATPEAARLMLEAIAAHPRGARVGFKASGGVRTVRDAAVYIDLVREGLGGAALVPARFRIGASSLLDDVEAVLEAAAR